MALRTRQPHLRHITLPDAKDPAELVRNGRGNLLQDAVYRNDPLAELSQTRR